MYLADVVGRESIPALEKMLAFTEARQRVLAENIANIDNPHYRTKQLDVRAFQESLRAAIEAQKESPSAEFRLPAGDETWQGENGRLKVAAGEKPPENLLFHDDTNGRIERQMAMLAENSLMHQTMTELLRSRYEGLLKSIRGRT